MVSVAFACWLTAAATVGSFRGTIVDPPEAAAKQGWIYVQGRNGMARRVDVSRAQVAYDDEVPAAERRAKPEEALVTGTEVRVTAEEDGGGEWQASRVEILKAVASGQKAVVSRQLPVEKARIIARPGRVAKPPRENITEQQSFRTRHSGNIIPGTSFRTLRREISLNSNDWGHYK